MYWISSAIHSGVTNISLSWIFILSNHASLMPHFRIDSKGVDQAADLTEVQKLHRSLS